MAQLDRLLDLLEVRRVELAALGLERRPRDAQPHDVEAVLGDAGEVLFGERPGLVHLGPRLVEVDELVDVDAAQQHLVAVAVRDDVAVRAQEARGQRVSSAGGGRAPRRPA